MFKLFIFSTLLAIAFAYPTILHHDNLHHDIHEVHAVHEVPITTHITATHIVPGYRTVLAPETIHVHEPAIAKVGDLVQKIPTSVSHQSQTVVHNHADVITPIIAPAVKTSTHHVVKSYTTPLVYASAAPVIKVLHD